MSIDVAVHALVLQEQSASRNEIAYNGQGEARGST